MHTQRKVNDPKWIHKKQKIDDDFDTNVYSTCNLSKKI